MKDKHRIRSSWTDGKISIPAVMAVAAGAICLIGERSVNCS